MALFRSRAARTTAEQKELREFDDWIEQVREPNMADVNLHRLSAEITHLRNELLTSQGQLYVRRAKANKNITQIRQDLLRLQGMCYAWLYVSGKWEHVSAITELTEEVNDLTMIWLSVDLIKMFGQAFPAKAPNDTKPQPHPAERAANIIRKEYAASVPLGGYDKHEYKPDFAKTGDPCDVCGFERNNPLHR